MATSIKILGPGCAKCKATFDVVKRAVEQTVVGLSIPEATLLKKVMTTKLVLIFFGVVAVCIAISGYLFNIIL